MDVLKEIWERNSIKYFTIEEITLGRNIPIDLLPNIEPTIVFVDKMRTKLGFPISITSSWRSQSLNEQIGGSKDSLHLVFNALDCVPSSGERKQLVLMHDYAFKNRTNEMGIGYYRTFLHIDTRAFVGRKSPATWGTKKL